MLNKILECLVYLTNFKKCAFSTKKKNSFTDSFNMGMQEQTLLIIRQKSVQDTKNQLHDHFPCFFHEIKNHLKR